MPLELKIRYLMAPKHGQPVDTESEHLTPAIMPT